MEIGRERITNKACETDISFLEGGTVLELFIAYPWLLVIGFVALIPITGIVFGTVTSYLTKTRLAELDAGLKHEMLQRNMTAEEIQIVLNTSSRAGRRDKDCSRRAARCGEV
jgi:hypothetical protein